MNADDHNYRVLIVSGDELDSAIKQLNADKLTIACIDALTRKQPIRFRITATRENWAEDRD
jgi:hypothetical protein